MKNNKGITLIALVITIIVLLILAGISIAMLTGDNGILTQAGNAKTETIQGEVEEACKLTVATLIAENKGTPSGGYTTSNVSTTIQKINSSYDWSVTEATGAKDIKVEAKKGESVLATYYINKANGVVSLTETE